MGKPFVKGIKNWMRIGGLNCSLTGKARELQKIMELLKEFKRFFFKNNEETEWRGLTWLANGAEDKIKSIFLRQCFIYISNL